METKINTDFDLIIIGSGTAGYVAAIRAAQTGLRTAVIEKSKVGGMCLNWGCIPSKVFLESGKMLQKIKTAGEFGITGINLSEISFDWKSALKRKDKIVSKLTGGVNYLLKKNGVEVIKGEARIVNAGIVTVNNRRLSTKNIFIATGSRPEKKSYPIPPELIWEIDQLFQADKIPESVLVSGQSPTAFELAIFFKLIGKETHILIHQTPLMPMLDDYLSTFALKTLKKMNINVISDKTISGFEDGQIIIEDEKIRVDAVINSEMRRAVLPPSDMDFHINADGFIKIDEYMQTSIPGIFAIGDVNGKMPLAHVGSAQGLKAVDFLNGVKEKMDYSKYPINIYSLPEIAQIGYTETQLKEMKTPYRIDEFPLSANGKALTEGNSEGFIRLLSETKYGEVMGVQIVAENATDMIAEAGVMLQLESTIYDLSNIVHAHPTVSEIFMEAGHRATGKPVHI